MDVHPDLATHHTALLRQQLTDLGQYQDLLDGQRAVAQMDNAGLLGTFLVEADRVLTTMAARQLRLADAQRVINRAGRNDTAAGQARELRRQVEREVARLRSEVHSFTDLLVRKQEALATQLASISQQERDAAYGAGSVPTPKMVDTIG